MIFTIAPVLAVNKQGERSRWVKAVFVLSAAMLCTAMEPASRKNKDAAESTGIVSRCEIVPETRTVRGTSLEPLLQEGQTITLLRGYYKCHPMERNDVVAYRYAGNNNPIIKIVKGLAGDTFDMRSTADGADWQIVVNGEIVTTSEDIPYSLNQRGARMLTLYVRNYGGVIPEHNCLLLGNRPGGSLDSTRFGLVDHNDLIGKVSLGNHQQIYP